MKLILVARIRFSLHRNFLIIGKSSPIKPPPTLQTSHSFQFHNSPPVCTALCALECQRNTVDYYLIVLLLFATLQVG